MKLDRRVILTDPQKYRQTNFKYMRNEHMYQPHEIVPYSLAGNIVPRIHGYHDSDAEAVRGHYFHSDQYRIGVYAQDWNMVAGGTWQQNGMLQRYPAHFRTPVAPAYDKTQKVLLTRKYLLELQARRAIEANKYGTSQSQLMLGNYKAGNP